MTTSHTVQKIAALLCVVAAGCSELADATGLGEQGVLDPPSLSTAATYTPGQPISVDFAGFGGAATDWVTLAAPAADDTVYLAYAFTGGGDMGSVTFSNGLPAGTYEARAYFDWEGTQSYTRQATTAFTVSAVAAPPITTDSTHYAVGASVVVTYSGMPGTSTDWIGIAVPSSPATSFVRYMYTNGDPGGSVTFNGLPAGTYVARSFGNDSFDLVGESVAFSIGNVVSTSQAVYSPTDSIVVDYAGLTSDPTDWIAIAPAGAAATSYLQWFYQNDTTGSGQMLFSALAPGNYEVRAFLHDGFTSAGSAAFSVASAATATITTDAPTYTDAETVTMNYTFTGDATDWVSVSVAGSPATAYLRWTYVSPTGTSQFAGLAPGNYEARLYASNEFTVVDSYAFSVTSSVGTASVTPTSTTFAASDPIVIDFAGLGGVQDWVGIAVAGSLDTEYVAYQYTTSAAGQLTFGSLPAGSYEVRGYLANSYTVGARSTFTVSP